MRPHMKNWKTTAFGIVAAFFGFVLFKPQHFPLVLVDVAAYVMAGGIAGLGISSKDSAK